jgi:VIT1/CCC1 family predicted Fe2+/Mn2+ transporter
MKEQWKAGVSFGLTSGAITTMGLMVGLHSGTHAKLAVIGGVVTIAVADAFSDALGVHIHEEAENVHSHKEVWVITLATFISKFVFSLSFIIPLLLLQLDTAVVVSVVWGLFLVALISAFVAKDQGIKMKPVIAEHVFIALLVVVITHFLGVWVNSIFVG